ncbi:MAG: tRNA epoxyqueuosine(34) reductase QueG [Kiritimatiellae bacterium]|nr:tRNA epoxyqueuosine(34) reductase QueG [Kiritimatiellia bacterium]MDW8457604.1 tRNA epoxyqueuosine(34) reductase QueG [Verrucomicrobiota bacterium]
MDAERIKERALEIGFDAVGIAAAGSAPTGDRFLEWLAHGRHAEMAWLARDPDRRINPSRVLPSVRSILVVGLSYYVEDPPPEMWGDPLRGRIARYAWGLDYHDEMLPRLRELAAWIESEAGRPVAHRAYVDTGPILERSWAEQAGVGFIGKHTLVIHPNFGSYLFLGEILLELELEPDLPGQERLGTCGRCQRCLEICPTHALPAPYVLDSRRCISYLTIEHRGSIPVELRPLMKNWIYGCDDCQAVCPWVRRFSRPGRARFLAFDPERFAPRLTDAITWDEAEFRARYRGTPIPRAKRRGFVRNVCVALGNSGCRDAIPALERAASDPDPIIAEHAAWALSRLREL